MGGDTSEIFSSFAECNAANAWFADREPEHSDCAEDSRTGVTAEG